MRFCYFSSLNPSTICISSGGSGHRVCRRAGVLFSASNWNCCFFDFQLHVNSFLDAFAIWLPSFFTRLSSFFISSSGGIFSGIISLFVSTCRISVLFFTCSDVMSASPHKLFFWILKFVISVAKFLALIVTVGRKSAIALLFGIPIFFFTWRVVSPPNNA